MLHDQVTDVEELLELRAVLEGVTAAFVGDGEDVFVGTDDVG